MTSNPVLVEVTRGGIVESCHRGAFAVVTAEGELVASAGDVSRPVFPRSAIKAIQALAMVEAGAADRFGFSDSELALACASHGGEPEHVATCRTMLTKIGLTEDDLECGVHRPSSSQAARDLIVDGRSPTPLHNNCSGKHAGMLALARHLGAPTRGYTEPGHPVQQAIAGVLSDLCDYPIATATRGVDGSTVPTWAVPLENLALGFARLAVQGGFDEARAAAARRLIAAAAAHPFHIAGTGRFCTEVMQSVPRAFVKTGAEGVFCGAVPHAGLGIALKCDDGHTRASESMMAAVLARFGGFSDEERTRLEAFAGRALTNHRGRHVGDVRIVEDAFAAG